MTTAEPSGTGATRREPQYWVNTISLDHVLLGAAGGFTHADHGKPTRLQRLQEDDWMVFYSPRTAIGSGEVVQKFTALGRVTADPMYQVTMSETFHPWRRTLEFQTVEPVGIRPLLPLLSFTRDRDNWGLAFRRGLFQIPREDFEIIRENLQPR